MNGLVSFLIAPQNQGKVRLALWLCCFLALLWASGGLISRELHASMNAEAARVLEPYARVRDSVLETLGIMERELTAKPCSLDYTEQQRRVAFQPDGMNELFFFENGKIICTANLGLLPRPVDLGEPDVVPIKPFTVTLWFDRSLDAVGLAGLEGTYAVRGNHGIVAPSTPIASQAADWLDFEVVVHAPDGRWWHSAGEPGLYAASLAEPNGPFGLRNGAFTTTLCVPAGLHCIAARAELGQLLVVGGAIAGLAGLVAAILAAWLAARLYALAASFWSFESRFLRRFQKSGITCAYQPLLDLEKNAVTGCEALARWRDVDGTLVYPDRFIPLIEKHGLTGTFTRLVVEKAHADLLPLLPAGQKLQVNFNIFPQDLDAERLIETFAPFLGPDSPFHLVIEIVETSAIELDTAQGEIERLRGAGIGIYIDDFGSGYSSMHTLAGLSVDGVKLDRGFAMAPDESMMARMLDHAIDMVQASGRRIVVEGVETAARLSMLKASGKVDFAQGYHVSRPLEIAAFARFLAERGPASMKKARLVA